MLRLMKHHEIQVLLRAHHTQKNVAEGVRKLVQATLKARPDLDVVQILHGAQLAGYRGGDSTFDELVASLRPKSEEPLSQVEKLAATSTKDASHTKRLESLAGSSCQHDQKTHVGGDGERVRAIPTGRQTATCYSFRLEYGGRAPLPASALAEADILPDWYRDFTISGQNTLEQLSSVILMILDWNPDHL